MGLFSRNPANLSKGARERRAYWRGLPLSRLRYLLLAVFFTFGTIGLLSSILNAAKTPLVIGFGWALITGFTSICYVIVFARNPKFFPLVVVFQLLMTTGYSTLSGRLSAHEWLLPVPEHKAITVFVTVAIIFLTLGYACFLIFIEREGKQVVRAQAELALAHGIQQTLVPRLELKVAGCEIFGISLPSDKVGGDIVDVVTLPDGSVVAYVADVAGHGLQAGILMGMVKTAVRTQLLGDPRLDMLFTRLNQVMPEVKEAHMYATCAALRLGPDAVDSSLSVEFAVAGHPSILRIHGGSGDAEYFSDEQLPLGLFPFADYSSHSFCCQPGDMVAVTTDGVLEVEAEDGTQFGPERVEALMRREPRSDLSALALKILNAASAFGKQTDDQTLLLIRVL
jgi:Stage II sporulation protein E (SpoIIE)